MISSALPARLQFQCGHAALVTLPRVKGETAAQRNERIGREKSAALTRQCDFCAPAVEIAVNGNGNHHAMADLHVLEPVTAESDRPELVVLSEAPETAEVAPEVEPVAEPGEPELVAEVVELELVPEVVGLELVAEAAEAALDAEIAELELVAELTETEPAPVDVVAEQPSPAPVADEEPVPAKAEDAAPAARVATPKRRAPQVRRARAAEVARGRRFLVEYRVERVLHAVDIHDALRQAASLGAAQLTAITRED